MMKVVWVRLLMLAAISVSGSTWSQYRCLDNGKTLYTDKPCDGAEKPNIQPSGSAPKVIGDAGNSAYLSRYGDWRGQIQYQANFKGVPVSEAHAVVSTTISIDPQGKIIGASTENGCKMKGISTPGMTPTLLQLDITLSGCSFNKLNRRLTGTLLLYPAEKHAQFWVYAMPADLLNPGWNYELRGTLRR